MLKKNPIVSACFFAPSGISTELNAIHLKHKTTSVKDWYKSAELNYPKFFKMDEMSKLALLLAEECLKKVHPINSSMGIAWANKEASYSADFKHTENINQNPPLVNPANFVYTLPNICIGEIAIKHKITGENCFFIADNLPNSGIPLYLCASKKSIPLVLIGWLEWMENTWYGYAAVVHNNEAIEVNLNEIDKYWQQLKLLPPII